MDTDKDQHHCFILYQVKQAAIKSALKFSTYDKFSDTSRREELQTRKPLSLILASSSKTKKRQTTGFVYA